MGAVYRVAHDAVFRGWTRLAERIERDREPIRRLNDLRRAAVRWGREGEPEHLLNHRGQGLIAVREALARPGYDRPLEEIPARYLAACEAAERAGKKERTMQRVRWSASAVSLSPRDASHSFFT